MKTKTAKMLPKTAEQIQNGGLYIQRVRCGKSNCKCARGESHTAYYFFTRHNGKLIKFYVRKSDVAAFSKLVNLASIERLRKQQWAQSSMALLKYLREFVRKDELTTKLCKQNYKYEQN